MTPEQIAEIGVSGKGYWLFDRNGSQVSAGEGIMCELSNSVLFYDFDIPGTYDLLWAIYKWIPSHRS